MPIGWGDHIDSEPTPGEVQAQVALQLREAKTRRLFPDLRALAVHWPLRNGVLAKSTGDGEQKLCC